MKFNLGLKTINRGYQKVIMKSSKEILNEIYSYDNYVVFLKDYFGSLANEIKRFSYRAFSRKVGLQSPNLIGLVLQEKRTLSEENAEKIADGLGLKTRKRRYFLSLVAFNQTKGDEADVFFKELIRIKKSSNFISVEEKQYRYYEKWYYAVVRELACMDYWGDDYSILGRSCSPSISAIEAERAVKLLLEIEMIREVDGFEGKYELVNENIISDKVPVHKKLGDRKKWLENSVESLEKYGPDIRNTQYKTFSLLKEDYNKIVKIVDEANKKIDEIVNDTSGVNGKREIYEFISNLFPVSSIEKEKGNLE